MLTCRVLADRSIGKNKKKQRKKREKVWLVAPCSGGQPPCFVTNAVIDATAAKPFFCSLDQTIRSQVQKKSEPSYS